MATIAAPARHDLKAIKAFTVSLSPEISLRSPSQGRGAISEPQREGLSVAQGGKWNKFYGPSFSKNTKFSYPQLEPVAGTSPPAA